jgi:hypothetical protein
MQQISAPYGSHGMRWRTLGPAPGRILVGAALSRCRVARGKGDRTPARRSGSAGTPCCRVCRPEVRAGPEWTLAAPPVAK